MLLDEAVACALIEYFGDAATMLEELSLSFGGER